MKGVNITFDYKGRKIRGWYMIFRQDCYHLKMTLPYIIEITIYREMSHSPCQNGNKAKKIARDNLCLLFDYVEIIKSNINKFEEILSEYYKLDERLTEIELKGNFKDNSMSFRDFDSYTRYELNQYYKILFDRAFGKNSIEYALHNKLASFLLEKIIFAVKNQGIEIKLYEDEV